MFTQRYLHLSTLAFTLLCLGADAPTRTIEAEGLTFRAPEAWKSSKPTSTMRKAQLSVEPARGDKDKAELAVYKFPGGAGTVQANIDRWQSQFRDKDGKAPKVESKTVKGKNVDVTRVEVAGTYTDTLN